MSVYCVQRAGDVVLSGPVLVARAWADCCADGFGGTIPEAEWNVR